MSSAYQADPGDVAERCDPTFGLVDVSYERWRAVERIDMEGEPRLLVVVEIQHCGRIST
jgi:hypothetical protein